MTAFRERIVDVSQRRVGEVDCNARNPKRRTDVKTGRLTAVLEQFGKAGVLLTYFDGEGVERFFDGNTRMQLDSDEVWYIARTDLSQAEVDDLVMLYDPLAMPDWDGAMLDELMRKTAVTDEVLKGMLGEIGADAGLGRLERELGEDGEAQVSRADELRDLWQVEAGQVWWLPARDGGKGGHRLAVGDCTDEGVVTAVMDGDRAEMVWTDPPYGVDIVGKNRVLNLVDKQGRVDDRGMVNDDVEESVLDGVLRRSFALAASVCRAGGAWYVAVPSGPGMMIFGQVLRDMGIWHQTIHWVKNHWTLAMMGSDYHLRAELVLYGWLPGAAHRFYGGRQQDTVWEIARPMASPDHPTMKPVGLVTRAVGNSSKPGDVVYDPFAGSGTTILACEQMGRWGRAVEVDLGYCAVILQRYQDLCGVVPQRVA